MQDWKGIYFFSVFINEELFWKEIKSFWNPMEIFMCEDHEDSWAVEQAAQGGCAISILGSFQGSAGWNPEQPGVTP